jgi:uncharacterized protein YndB with AHSA1/START domain
MRNHSPTSSASQGPQVLITRVFAAPRALVFKAWTEQAQLMRWFAPNGCSIEYRRFEFKPGGRYHSCIHTPDGHQCWCVGEYREIMAPERVVFTMAIGDAEGNRRDPISAGMDPAWPEETVVTITLQEQDGKTTLTLQQTVNEALAKRTGAHPSWLQMFDRLAEELTHTLSADIYP